MFEVTEPFNVVGSWLLNGQSWQNAVGLIQNINWKAFKSLRISSQFIQKWQYSCLPKYNENPILRRVNLSTLLVYSSKMVKASKMKQQWQDEDEHHNVDDNDDDEDDSDDKSSQIENQKW